MEFFRKKASDRLDYYVDWSAWIPEGDEIYESSWEAPDGMEISGPSFDRTSHFTSVWVSGGTPGSIYEIPKAYELPNRIVTVDGRSKEFRITIKIS